jgi:hypothetical protein
MAQKIPKNHKLFILYIFSVSEKKNLKLRNYTQKKKKKKTGMILLMKYKGRAVGSKKVQRGGN